MANLEDRWSRRWPSHTAEKFVPTSFWTQDDEDNHVLDIDLPGFKHEEVRIELASDDHIKIEGERIVNENKCIYMDQTFKIPKNTDINNIGGKFEGERLLITFPKIIEENKQEDSGIIGNGNTSNNVEESSHEEEEEKETNNNHENQTELRDRNTKRKSSDSPLETAIKCLGRNKRVLSLVISFSIGVLVSKLWIN
ncbi:hypothetical protein DITRI_Ditri04bG0056100 [Diplodiscus trichospermus]